MWYGSSAALRLVMMAEGNHAFPSRTRPLSPPAQRVLEPQGSGRVGRCQAGKCPLRWALVIFYISRGGAAR
jgi:hypothetical protein